MPLKLARTLLLLAPFSLALLTPAPLVYAQSESGRAAISGRVTDAAGVTVAGATLTLRDTQTDAVRTVTSDRAGRFDYPALNVGTYLLEASAPTFGTTRIENILLSVGQNAEINVALKAASVQAAVVVNADDDSDPTHRAETDNSTVIGNAVVEDLPTRGRNFTDFALLTPGISQDGDRFGLVVNGQRSGNSNVSLDGVDFNDPLQNGQRGGSVSVYFFPQVAVREFQVVRSGASASIGRTNAGFVNVVTKSGTNRFHGEALYTNRNPLFTWPDALNDPESNNNQNQFAFGVGGPILHDKLFFYAAIEKTQFQVPFFVRFNSCPTAGYYDPTGLNPNCTLATNPGTAPLPANIVALEVPGYGNNNPLASSGRLDWQVNQRNTVSLNYLSTFLSGVQFGSSGIQSAAASNNTNYGQQSQGLIAGLVTVLGSNRTNEVKVQYVYDNRLQTPDTTGPQIDISDLGTLGGNSGGTNIYRAIRAEVLDNYSWTLGRHFLRFGVDLNFEPETQQREDNANGDWVIDTFQDYLAALPVSQGGGGLTPLQINTPGCTASGTVNANGTFTPGTACQFQYIQTLPYSGIPAQYKGTQYDLGGYIQDTFHVLPRVTLNLGLRYEVQLEPAAPSNPAIPGTGVNPGDFGMIQPRLGVAWDVHGDGSTVVRASTGLFDARTPGYILARNFTDNGLSNATLNSSYDQTLLSKVPYLGSLSAIPTGSPTLNEIYTDNPAFRNPRSAQVAFAVEQRLTRRSVLVLQFTQQETWKLQHRLNTNLFPPTIDASTLYPVFPTISPVTGLSCKFGTTPVPCHPNNTIAGFHQNFSTSHATYRSLIVQLKGNVTRKLTGVANYTWASSRDDDSNERDYNRELALDPLCTACYNRGYSKQDIRSNFNLHGIYRLPLKFTFSTSFIARTALPYSAVTSGAKQGDFNNDGDTANDRPILCSQVRFTVCAINPNAINAYKGGAAVGYVAGRNTFREDGFLNWDMRLIKAFPIRGKQLQVSAECLNCSRSSNLNLGANQVSKFTHAQTTLNPITGYYYSGNNAGFMLNAYDTFRSGGPRQIQMSARFLF